MPYKAVEVANEFLKLAHAEGRDLTNMQLQKLVYFAHGWHLAVTGEPLTDDDPRAWDYGPVYRDLWEHLKRYGRQVISRLISEDDINPFARLFNKPPADPYQANLDGQALELIKTVWRKYGGYSAFKLSDLTHMAGTPWDQTYFGEGGKNASIDPKLIEKHYIELGRTSRGRTPVT